MKRSCLDISLVARHKGGFTLMELMVYIAILGIVVIIAGQAFSDSTKIRVRTQSMLKASEVAGNVATLLKEDVAQIGAKSSKEASEVTAADVFYTDAIEKVYMDPNNGDGDKVDSSSYGIASLNGQDKLTMRRVRYNESGHYSAVEEVAWFVNGNRTLIRSCKTLEGAADDTYCPKDKAVEVIVADSVRLFSVAPGIPTVQSTAVSVLPSVTESVEEFRLVPRYEDENFVYLEASPNNGGKSVSLSGFVANYDFNAQKPVEDEAYVRANQMFVAEANSESGIWKTLCKTVTLDSGVVYEISFAMPANGEDASRMFCPGRDHMSVGFRYIDDGSRPEDLDDFMFYPPTIGSSADMAERRMRFSVPHTIADVCLGFTFASYSPLAALGKITISNLKLRKITSATYKFDSASSIAIPDKKNVKALRVHFVTAKNGETGVDSLVIPIPSNGPRD